MKGFIIRGAADSGRHWTRTSGFGALTVGLAAIALTACTSPIPEPDAPESGTATVEAAIVSCAWEIIGGADTCYNPVDFTAVAKDFCAARDAEFESIGYADSCGTGMWRRAKVSCCEAGTAGEPAIEPIDEPAPSCTLQTLGATNVCVSAAEFKSQAASYCGDRAVTGLGYAGACQNGWHFAKFECCDGAPEAPPACVQDVTGGSLVCRSEADWKIALHATCQEEGRDLTQTSFASSCGPGLWSYAKYSCCASAIEPVDPTDPPTGLPQATACKSKIFGASNVCQTADAWKAAAAGYCEESDRQATNVSYADSCGPGAFRYAQITCCDAPESDGPDFDEFGCFVASTDKEDACQTAPQWREEAAQACAGWDRQLDSLGVSAACDVSKWSGAKYKCCPAPAAPEPPAVQQPTCSVKEIGEAGSCRSDASWHSIAAAMCAEQGAKSSGIKLSSQCSAGFYSTAAITCCVEAPSLEEPEACKADTLGDGTQCRTATEWKAAADAACTGDLTALGVNTSCAPGKWAYAKLTCCQDEAEPPVAEAPKQCTVDRFEDEGCRNSDYWDKRARETCSGQGLDLSGMRVTGSCGPQRFSRLDVKCCPKPAAATCEMDALIPATCVATSALIDEAKASCVTRGRSLSHYRAADECGHGKAQKLTYTCCED